MAQDRPLQSSGDQNAIGSALRTCRFAFAAIAVFSLILNALVLAQPLYMLQVYDRVLSTGRLETLLMLTIMASGALLALGALDILRSAMMVRIGRWFTAQLAPLFLRSSVRARLHGDEAGAQPLRDLGVLQNFISGAGLPFLFDMPMVPLFVALSWLLHPALGILAVISAVILFLLSLLNDFVTRKPLLEANVSQIRSNMEAEAAIRNAEVVRAMGMLPAMIDRWRITHNRSLNAAQRAAGRTGIILGLTKAIRLLVQIAILGLGAMLVIAGELTPGSMIACSILIGRALAPVEQAVTAWKVFIAARIAYTRLKGRLAMLPPETDHIRLPDPTGRLSLQRVTYIQPTSRQAVLQQLTFTVEPGEVLAIIGPSAAGKSTLCRLLVGLLQPTSGEVRLDGAELKQWDLDQLGRFIGYLPQDVELFSGTIGENIARMGDGDDEAIVEAAQLAHAHDMILRLPDGYDTQIGDAGARLSGGQRQRIGLARAVYGNPRLIILDEPNANLDQAGEAALAGAVIELRRRGIALVIVGHRPSTLAQADKILLLKDGKLELYGPRDAVLAKLRSAAAATANPAKAPQTDPDAVPADGRAVSNAAEQQSAKRPPEKMRRIAGGSSAPMQLHQPSATEEREAATVAAGRE